MKEMNQRMMIKTKMNQTAMTIARLGRSSKRSDRERLTLHGREDVSERKGKISGKEEKCLALILKRNVRNHYLLPDTKGRRALVYRPLAAPAS